MTNKKCLNCGKEFKPIKPNKVYCSNACRTAAYRQRHGISEPQFLTPKNLTPKNQGLGTTESVEKEVINPEYLRIKKSIQNTQNKLDELQQERNNLIIKQNKTIAKNYDDELIKLVVLTVSLGYMAGKAVDKKDKIIAILGAIAGGLGSYVWHESQADMRQQKKQQKLREIKESLDRLDGQIRLLSFNKAYYEREIKKLPKYQKQVIKIDKQPDPVLILSKQNEKIPLQNTAPQEMVINSKELKNIQFTELDFKSKSYEWFNALGNPADNFRLMIYGSPFNGKSTFAIKLAIFLSQNFGRVLFNSSEEGVSKSLQNKIPQGNDMFDIGTYKDAKTLIDYLKNTPKKPRFLVIDSVNSMNITPEELQKIIELDKKRSVIYIMQSNKDGTFKGSNEFRHEADIVLKIDNYQAINEKNRYI